MAARGPHDEGALTPLARKVIVLSPDEKTLFAANWPGDDVSIIDLATGKVDKRVLREGDGRPQATECPPNASRSAASICVA